MTAYFRFILKHRFLILALMGLISIASGYMFSRGIVASSMGKMFLGESPDYQSYLKRVDRFGSNEIIAVAFRDDDPLSPSSQKRLAAVVETIRTLEPVRDVGSILDVQQILGEGDDLVIRNYAEQALKGPETARAALDRLRADPFAGGLMISEDGRHIAVVIEVDSEEDLPAEMAPVLMADIYNAFTSRGYDRDALHLVGFTASAAVVVEQTQFNILKLFPIVCLTLVATVWLMFRRFWPVVMTMTVALIAVAWTMGFSVLLDRHITILASITPMVILIVSFSDVVHLCSAYLLELGRGRSKEEAIFASGVDVGRACFWTSITTFTGFVAMSFVPAPIFRQLGLVLGFGVGVSLLIAMTLVPIMFSLVPVPKPWRVGTAGRVQDLFDRVLEGMADLTNRRPWMVVIVSCLILLIAASALMQLKVETDFARRISADHRLRRDLAYFQEHFNGANMIDIFIDVPAKDGLLEPALFERVAGVGDAVAVMKEVSAVFSLVDLVEMLHAALNSDHEDPGRLPGTRGALAQYLLLFEMSGGEDLDNLVDFERRSMRMTLQLKDEAVRQTSITGMKAGRTARDAFGETASVEVSGLVYLMGQWLDEIIAGQQRGLGFAILTIALMMILGLHSVKAGLWSMIPNILPLIVLGGYLGLFWDQVDSDVLGLAMIAIGIGVDDTIHFLMRFRIESARQPDVETAIRRTFHFSGRGIVITTVILVCGFIPFYASDYLSIKCMGNLLPITLISALLADLLLVPAMVRLGIIRFDRAGP